MKTFTFTGTRQGDQIGTMSLPQGTGSSLIEIAGQPAKVTLTNVSRGRDGEIVWNWHNDVLDNRGNTITIDDFPGEEAVCFCLGKFSVGMGHEEWTWVVLSTEAWLFRQLEEGNVELTKMGD